MSVAEANQVMKRLRDAVDPPGKKGTWMRHLSDKQLGEVFYRLRTGQAPYFIVRKVVQGEWGMFVDSDPKSLARAVIAFQKKVLGDASVNLTSPSKGEAKKKEVEQYVNKQGKRVLEGLDSLGRLRWLIDLQTDRVELGLKREAGFGQPMKEVEQAVQTLGGLLTSYHKTLTEIGILKLQVDPLRVRGGVVGGLLDSMGSQRDSVMTAVDTLLERLEADAVEMKPNADGSFTAVDPDGESNEDD